MASPPKMNVVASFVILILIVSQQSVNCSTTNETSTSTISETKSTTITKSSIESTTESLPASDDYDSNDEDVTELPLLATSKSTYQPSLVNPVKSTTTTSPTIKTTDLPSTTDANYNYDDESDDSELDNREPDTSLSRSTSMPYEVEGESLSKLQKFLLSSVESLLKEALPVVLRSGQETNVSSECAASFFTLMNALRDSKIWAYRSEY